MLLVVKVVFCVCVTFKLFYLPSRLHSFPHAEVTDDPRQQQTESQLPSNTAQLIDAACDT